MPQFDILIYCDGACSGNPGPGGWGAIVGDSQKQVTELGGFQNQTTNNQMELRGAIEALRFIESTPGSVGVLTDSVYVIRGITQWAYGWQKRGWTTAEGKPVSNREYWEELVSVVAKRKKSFPDGKISWNFVRGHIGIKGNERCDEIAVAFSHRENPDLFEGTNEHYNFDFFKMPALEPLPEMKGASKGEKKVALSYLSLVGTIPMRHASWAECERRVKGQSGAKFKKAMSSEDESQILQSWGLKPDALKGS